MISDVAMSAGPAMLSSVACRGFSAIHGYDLVARAGGVPVRSP
jgi:hypothetical protein